MIQQKEVGTGRTNLINRFRSYRKKETKSDDATKLTINNIICKKITKKNIFWKKICNYKKKFLILRVVS